MRKGKIILLATWLGAVVLLVLITLFNQAKTDKFMGITTNNEHIINFSYPVQLKKSYVLPGQKVKKGDLLVELVRSDLAFKINILNNNIAELTANKTIDIDNLDRQLQTLSVKHELKIDNIEMQLKQKQLKLKAFKRLLQAVSDANQKSISPLEYEIKALKQEKKSIQTIYLNDKKHLLEKRVNRYAQFEAQINELLEEKNILNTKEDRLTVYSPIDGEVGSIHHSENSQIKAFDSILKIHSLYPESVTGYIHEDIVNDLVVGQKVSVTAYNKTDSTKKAIYGTIESIENRIEEIPLKLKRYKIAPLWGYKVLINLPKNDLQLDKKVMIESNIEKNIFKSKLEPFLTFLNLN